MKAERKELLIKGSIIIAFLSALSKHTRGAEFLGYIYPVIFIILIAISFKEILKIKEYKIFLLLNTTFTLWAAATSLWSEYPMVSLSRSAAYWLVTTGGIVSAYLWLKESKKFNLNLLVVINAVVVFLALVSILFAFPADAWSGGNGLGLMSFFAHQNTLGSLFLFSMPATFLAYINSDKNKIAYTLILFLLALSIVILIGTYSRASIISLYFFSISYGIFLLKWKFIAVNILIIAAAGILYFLSKDISTTVDNVVKKSFNTFFASREYIWESSFRAAEEGGAAGLGYGISSPGIKVPASGSHFENGRYLREKGNSVLALVEETGIIGMLLFFLPVGYIFTRKINRFRLHGGMNAWMHERVDRVKNIGMSNSDNKQKKYSHMQTCSHSIMPLVISILPALILHAQFEAWMVGVGSFQLMFFFVFLAFLYNGSIGKPAKS